MRTTSLCMKLIIAGLFFFNITANDPKISLLLNYMEQFIVQNNDSMLPMIRTCILQNKLTDIEVYRGLFEKYKSVPCAILQICKSLGVQNNLATDCESLQSTCQFENILRALKSRKHSHFQFIEQLPRNERNGLKQKLQDVLRYMGRYKLLVEELRNPTLVGAGNFSLIKKSTISKVIVAVYAIISLSVIICLLDRRAQILTYDYNQCIATEDYRNCVRVKSACETDEPMSQWLENFSKEYCDKLYCTAQREPLMGLILFSLLLISAGGVLSQCALYPDSVFDKLEKFNNFAYKYFDQINRRIGLQERFSS